MECVYLNKDALMEHMLDIHGDQLNGLPPQQVYFNYTISLMVFDNKTIIHEEVAEIKAGIFCYGHSDFNKKTELGADVDSLIHKGEKAKSLSLSKK